MTFLRSAAGQSAAYALVLGALFGLPGAAAFAVAALHVNFATFPEAIIVMGWFLVGIAVVGAVPAMVAAAIVWCVFLRRHNGSPPFDVVPYCWIVTLAGSYFMIPFWGLLVSSIVASPLRPVELLGAGFGVVVMSFIFTVPYVAPVMYLGTWLWVRRIQPRVVAGGVMTA